MKSPADMSDTPSDRWTSGDAYEAYMGRWSRALARVFVEWLRPAPDLHWLDVGRGTGALTAAIHELGRPATIVGCDPSPPFIEHARGALAGAATFCVMPSDQALPSRGGGFDVVVSGLALNFMPEPARSLAAMRGRIRAGGTVAAYVWDYPEMELLACFWQEAAALDPRAAEMDESRRFAGWTLPSMAALFEAGGLRGVSTGVLEIPAELADFDDYWRPFLAGTGPAPSYLASLDALHREELRARLERRLTAGGVRLIRLRARALAVRGSA